MDTVARKVGSTPRTIYKYLDIAYMNPKRANQILDGKTMDFGAYCDITESRTNKKLKINHIQARHFRIWIEKKVLRIDSAKLHFLIRYKKRYFKIVYGRSGR